MAGVSLDVPDLPPWAWGAVAVGALALVAWVGKKGAGGVAHDIGEGAVDGVFGVADGLFSGLVKNAGKLIGVPETDAEKCAAAKAAGKWYEASKYCKAGDFMGWVWDGTPH